jgi:GntR family transcriptional regulator
MDISNLDRQSSTPLYLQIRDLLLQAIERNELPPRQQAPSERELSTLTGVSRMTVRQALQSLVAEGWLYTVPGRGTFVADSSKIEQNLRQLTGFTEELQSQGFTPGSQVLSTELIPAEEEIAAVLKIEPGAALIRITRLRLANGVPVALEAAHLVQAMFLGLERNDFNSQSLYEVLQAQYQLRPVRADQTIEANQVDPMTAKLLAISTDRPVLSMERITYTADDQPFEYVRSVYRADYFRLRVELHTDLEVGLQSGRLTKEVIPVLRPIPAGA